MPWDDGSPCGVAVPDNDDIGVRASDALRVPDCYSRGIGHSRGIAFAMAITSSSERFVEIAYCLSGVLQTSVVRCRLPSSCRS